MIDLGGNGLLRRVALEAVAQDAQVELGRRQHLLQVVVQDFRQLPALAVLGLRQLQRQLLKLAGPVLQLRRAPDHLALQCGGQLAQRLLRAFAVGVVEEVAFDLVQAVLIVELAHEAFHNVDRFSVAAFAPDLEAFDLPLLPESLDQGFSLPDVQVQIDDARPDRIQGTGKSEHRGKGRIAQENSPFGRADEVARQVVLEQTMELLLAAAQRLLCLAAFADVLDGPDEVLPAVVGVVNGGHRHVGPQRRAVVPEIAFLVVEPVGLLLTKLCVQNITVGAVFGGGQLVDRLAYEFLATVPENSAETVIDRDDAVIEPDLDQADPGVIERGPQSLLTVAQRLLVVAQLLVGGRQFLGLHLQLRGLPLQLLRLPLELRFTLAQADASAAHRLGDEAHGHAARREDHKPGQDHGIAEAHPPGGGIEQQVNAHPGSGCRQQARSEPAERRGRDPREVERQKWSRVQHLRRQHPAQTRSPPPRETATNHSSPAGAADPDRAASRSFCSVIGFGPPPEIFLIPVPYTNFIC